MEKKVTPTTETWMKNPWSDTLTKITWAEIVEFAQNNVHQNDRKSWLWDAEQAVFDGDYATLGNMIIGS